MPVAPPKHRPAHYKDRRQKDQDRGSAAARGYDAAWRRVRDQHLQRHPLCVECEGRGVVAAASVVDHIRPISERPDLRLDLSNLRSLCKTCHDAHTARQVAAGHRGMHARRP